MIRLLLPFTLLLQLAGCSFFNTTGPMGPEYLAMPEPSMARVTYAAAGQGTAAVTAVQVNVRTLVRPQTPGLSLGAYRLDYLDQSGQPLVELGQQRLELATPLEVPTPLSTTTYAQVDLPLAPVSQAVEVYGRSLVAGAGDLHTIDCRVTIFGRTADSQDVELTTDIPIRFERGAQ